ncbi:MAG: hypothetical protein JOY84_04080 [Curvibacter sp.]|nr:hypothetical protein [Curvibacter sp.]
MSQSQSHFCYPDLTVYDCQEAQRLIPALGPARHQCRRVAARQCGRIPAAFGYVADTGRLMALLRDDLWSRGIQAHQVAPLAVVLELPMDLEPLLGTLFALQPQVLNRHTLDKQQNDTYLAWGCEPAGQTPVELMVTWASIADAALSASRAYSSWGWLPLVVRSGYTNAVTGIVVDESFELAIQATTDSARSYRPSQVWTDEDLEAAARQAQHHGLRPWVHGVCFEDGHRMLGIDLAMSY